AMPLDTFEELADGPEVGTDVSELLKVVKYEAPIPACLSGQIKGHRPSWIPKTDEERVQNLVDEIKEWAGTECYITEKLDGSSSTFYYAPNYRKATPFGVCSRKLDLIENDKNSFWKVARDIDAEEKMSKLGINVIFQGELLGPGIQKNKYKLSATEVKMFNAFTIQDGGFGSIESFLNLIFGDYTTEGEVRVRGLDRIFNTVPVLNPKMVLNHTVDELVELSKGPSLLNPDIPREGIVIRARDGSFSFKVINPDFLIKFGE
ncbi:MAG: hypothetical protein HOG49_37180, partial [Candidatus Scalindua sp.]|nr:hypothetical protein [Candidatus Scalindua sp.]